MHLSPNIHLLKDICLKRVELKWIDVHLSFSSLQQVLLRKSEMCFTPLPPNLFLFRHSSLRWDGFEFKDSHSVRQPLLVMPQSDSLYVGKNVQIHNMLAYIAWDNQTLNSNTRAISVFSHTQCISHTNTHKKLKSTYILTLRVVEKVLDKSPTLEYSVYRMDSAGLWRNVVFHQN